jgi:hypothetical protein
MIFQGTVEAIAAALNDSDKVSALTFSMDGRHTCLVVTNTY